MRKPKKPRPPMCICRTGADYIMGVVSPSLYFKYVVDYHASRILGEELDKNQRKIGLYLKKLNQYERDLVLWKIENRTATKEEYKRYARENRKREE